jgi:hypothetical protein
MSGLSQILFKRGARFPYARGAGGAVGILAFGHGFPIRGACFLL